MQRLLLDTMLGKLRTYLRMCGYDVEYGPEIDCVEDDALLERADYDDRVLVTRDRQLADRAPNSLLLEAKDLDGKLRELAEAGFELRFPAEPSRCSRCNDRLEAVGNEETTPADVPDPAEESVWRCRSCSQCFWRGSHWDDVEARLAALDDYDG